MRKKFKEEFFYLFWIFIFSCIAGWIIEGIFSFLRYGVLINHSAVVIGPFNIAYGLAACFLSFLLVKYKDDSYFKIFCIGFVGGTILEYIMSWGMELLLGFTAWDYSHRFLNINGRVCLLYSLFWGVLAILWIKVIYPFLLRFVQKINYSFGKKMMVFLIVFLIFDICLTLISVNRAREFERGIPPENKFEEVLDQTFNQDYLTNMYNNNWGAKE